MDSSKAITALAALAQDSRLAAFRLLVQAGPAGMGAGEIAGALGAKPNTTSQNLAQLMHAGLITNRRDGRAVIYRADMGGVNALLRFLLEDCCGGSPDTCAPLVETLAPCCPPKD